MIEFIETFSAAWANIFIIMSLQNVIFLSIVLSLLYFLRNSNAKILRIIALIGLIKLLVPPIKYLPTGLLNAPESYQE